MDNTGDDTLVMEPPGGPEFPKKKKSTPLWKIFSSRPEEHRVIKIIFGFPFGMLLGYGLYVAVIERIRLPMLLDRSMAAIVLVGLGAGYAISVQVRCISLLTVPTFSGKSGRGYIGAFIVANILMGPVANILDNAHEVTRSISCSFEVAMNLSQQRMELKLRPMQEIMKDLQGQSKTMRTTSAKLKKEFHPVEDEVGDETETITLKNNTEYTDVEVESEVQRSEEIEKKYEGMETKSEADQAEAKYEKKLDYRCEDIFSAGVTQCRKKFAEAYRKCNKKLSVLGKAFCWPMKITVICELVRILPSMAIKCDAMEAVNEGFGDGYQTADDAANSMEENFDVNMQYKLKARKEDIDKKTAKDVALAMEHEFSIRRKWANFFTLLFSRLTAFLFIRVIMSANSYHKNYTTKFQHDNIYITGYFKKIDKRRDEQNKTTLLPLKKLEKKDLIEPMKKTPSKAEKKKMIQGTIRLFLRTLTFTMIILMDRVIYEILDIIRRHSHIEYKQEGVHEISVTVYGEGAMGEMVRTLLNGFNAKHDIHNLASNMVCLPRPVKLPNKYLYAIFGYTALAWGLVLVESYALRLRRVIAAFFYPKREKKRILFTYNEMLKKRKGFTKHARHVVKRKIREQTLEKKSSLLSSLREEFPGLCCCLNKFASAKRKCLICAEPENKRFIRCFTPGCQADYCFECWVDIEENCYACRPYEEWSTGASSIDNDDGMD